MSGAASAASATATMTARPVRVQRLRTTRWRMSSAGLGITTTLLGGSPSGQAAGHVDSQTRFTPGLGGGGLKAAAPIGRRLGPPEARLVPGEIVAPGVGAAGGAA